MKIFVIPIFFIICVNSAIAYLEFGVYRDAFHIGLYKDALDEELCEAQLSYLLTNGTMLRAQFLDAGIRTPRSILQGNFVDLGNYHQCLAISTSFEPSDIEGKYCRINIPLMQDLPTLPESSEEWAEFPWPELLPNTKQHKDMMKNIEKLRADTIYYDQLAGPNQDLIRIAEGSELAGRAFRLAVCLPKACTTKQFIDTVLINTTAMGLTVTEEFCRLKNDKPFVAGDYVAMCIFGFLILFTVLSTCYDLHYCFIVKDPKRASTFKKSFSLYTNTRRLLTFNSAPGALDCLEGIRTLAILWIVVGHTYSTQSTTNFYNPLEIISWRNSFSAIWLLAASYSVDTFFLLSGLLLVYTSVGKMKQMNLFKTLHLFYLHRLLRLFPILAAGILLQATLYNHFSDGPQWYIVAEKVERCRTYWWSTLTYFQTYLTNSWCIRPTWYLAVDMQMHFLSPILLYWVLGNRRSAWIALTLALLSIMVASTTYNYLNEFPAAPGVPTRTPEDSYNYTKKYYINTLTRCSPFFVGMMFGYLLNVYKGKKVYLPTWFVAMTWICTFVVLAGIIYSVHPILLMDWNSPFWDGIINSFSRPGWAACLGWIIFASTHGYGGPINWFLSLNMWKLPARISFAMYIFHYPIIQIVNASVAEVQHFTVMRYFYRFLADLAATLLVSFIMTVAIDSPFSTLIKLVLGRDKRGKEVTRQDIEGTKGDTDVKDSKTTQ